MRRSELLGALSDALLRTLDPEDRWRLETFKSVLQWAASKRSRRHPVSRCRPVDGAVSSSITLALTGISTGVGRGSVAESDLPGPAHGEAHVTGHWGDGERDEQRGEHGGQQRPVAEPVRAEAGHAAHLRRSVRGPAWRHPRPRQSGHREGWVFDHLKPIFTAAQRIVVVTELIVL